MKIWAHTLVKNEERYLWFAVRSVIDYIDKILIWDTGSSDNTLKIISYLKKLYPNKVLFKEVGEVDIYEFTNVRQRMLDETKSDWFMILDGDEVWWDEEIKKGVEFIRRRGNFYDSLVHKFYNIVGDIYHYQEEEAGMYSIDSLKCHLNIRFVNRNIKGLHFDKPHGKQGIYDKDGVLIQERPKEKRVHFGVGYMHFTNVVRSKNIKKDLLVPKRDIKLKYELGFEFPFDFYYPEVFFKPKPGFVESPWEKMSVKFFIKSFLLTPFKRIKRRVFKSGSFGY